MNLQNKKIFYLATTIFDNTNRKVGISFVNDDIYIDRASSYIFARPDYNIFTMGIIIPDEYYDYIEELFDYFIKKTRYGKRLNHIRSKCELYNFYKDAKMIFEDFFNTYKTEYNLYLLTEDEISLLNCNYEKYLKLGSNGKDFNYPKKIPPSLINEKIYKDNKMEVFDYQKIYITEMIKELIKNKRCSNKTPTGGGKTCMVMKCLQNLEMENLINGTIIMTPRKILLNQIKNIFIEVFGLCEDDFYNFSDDKNINSLVKFIKNKNHPIILLCYQSYDSFYNNIIIKGLINNFCYFMDEYHEINNWRLTEEEAKRNNKSEELNQSIEYFQNDDKNFYIFTSATPYKEQIENKKIFGETIEFINARQLIEQKRLSDFLTYAMEYDDNNKNTKTEILYEHIIKKQRKKSLSFHNTQRGAFLNWSRMVVKDAIDAYLYIGDNKDLKKDIDDFLKNGNQKYKKYILDDNTISKINSETKKPEIVFVCKKITYGYDNKFIDCIFFTDRKNGLIDIKQVIGRGIRKYNDKITHIVILLGKESISSNNNNTLGNYILSLKEIGYEDKDPISFFTNKNSESLGGGKKQNNQEGEESFIDLVLLKKFSSLFSQDSLSYHKYIFNEYQKKYINIYPEKIEERVRNEIINNKFFKGWLDFYKLENIYSEKELREYCIKENINKYETYKEYANVNHRILYPDTFLIEEKYQKSLYEIISVKKRRRIK